jgi:hypothetical protein
VEEAARILVRRPAGGGRDLLRSYVIEIDGVEVGRVARDTQVVFPVEPGRHNVRAVIDWTGSPVVQVQVTAGETVRLTVGPAGSVVAAIFQSWKRDSYLTLSAE